MSAYKWMICQNDSARDAEKLAKKYDNIFNIQDTKGSDYDNSYLQGKVVDFREIVRLMETKFQTAER